MHSHQYSKKYLAWLLILLLVVSTLNGSDLIVFSVLAQAIKLDLKLTDLQLGVVGGAAFSLFYVSLGVPIARLAERYNRVAIISIATCVWSLMTALCGTASGFWQLALFRFGVGAGEAGFLAPASSLIADHFRPQRRASAMGIVRLGSPLAAVVGAIMAGWIADQWGWRTAIVVVGLPGVLVGILFFVSLREPSRGRVDSTFGESRVSFLSVINELLKKASFIHIAIAAAIAIFCASALGNFLAAFFYRSHGLTFGEAALAFGLINVAAFTMSALLGGIGLDWASKYNIKWYAWGPAIGMLLSVPLFLIGFAQQSVYWAAAFILLASTSLYIYYVPSIANIQNMMGPRSRATAVAIFTVFTHVCGAILGPLTLGWGSDFLARRSFAGGDFFSSCPGGSAPEGATVALVNACQGAAKQGLSGALSILVCVLVFGALHYFLAAKSLKRSFLQGEAFGELPTSSNKPPSKVAPV